MTDSLFFKLAATAAALLSSAAIALAQQPPGQFNASSPTCQRLIGQLSALDRGNEDPTRAGQIRQAEDAVNRQQFEVDKLVSRSRRMGCESSGFFSIFSNPPRQCGALSREIDRQRNTLDRLQNQLEQLNGGTTQRAAQRQSLLIALADNACGSQYRRAASAGEQGGFFDRLFGGNGGTLYSPAPSGPKGGTYRTICVRTCDGYYFPISFETTPDHFREDEQVCQRMCPAADVQLYTYHNPGEEVSQAVSLNGRLYTELPAAFQYRKALNPACSCRRPGESWYEALKANGPDETVAPGDVIVTDKKAEQLSQPHPAPAAKAAASSSKSATAKPGELRGSEAALAETPGKTDKTSDTKRKIRQVGPSFLPSH
jgi:Protein of unknown function (DUF2865)